MAEPLVVTVERAWHHFLRLLTFTAVDRIHKAQTAHRATRDLMRRR